MLGFICLGLLIGSFLVGAGSRANRRGNGSDYVNNDDFDEDDCH